MLKQIPGFEGYSISNKGEIRKGKEIIPCHINEAGYPSVSLLVKNERKIYRVHRLVMLTYGEKIDDWNERLVNHKDGNKLNCDKDNLEWSDYQHNNQHAYLNGLNTNGLPFMIYDFLTGDVFDAKNTRHATIFVSYPREKIYDYIKQGSCTPCKRFWFKSYDDDRNWSEVMESPKLKPKVSRAFRFKDDIVCKNKDQISIARSLSEASKITGLNRSGIKKKLEDKSLKPVKRWQFKLMSDERKFPDYTDAELDFMESCTGNSKPVKVTNLDNDTDKLYPSLTKFAEAQGVDNTYVCNIKNAVKNSGKWKNYTFVYL